MVKLALPFHTSAIIASVIETITGHTRITDLPAPGFFGRDETAHRWSIHDWIAMSTRGGRLPLCLVEASLGCPHSVEDVERFFTSSASADESNRGSMNPMLQSLSSAVYGPLGGLYDAVGGARGYSNADDEDVSAGEDDFDETEVMLRSNRTKMVPSVFSNTLFSRGCHDTGKCSISTFSSLQAVIDYGYHDVDINSFTRSYARATLFSLCSW
jgi:hypothetical protein